MRAETLGTGQPEVAVVGGIHGDEPCGWRAVEDLLEDPPDVERPVKLVVANEEAIESGVRFLEDDLNRSFPPSADDPGFEYADSHEGRLARRIVEEVRGCLVLSLHSTQSFPEPFAVVAEPDERELEIAVRLPVHSVVESGAFTQGRLIETLPTIEVECGYQGSDQATENAKRIVDAFLRATGVLPDPLPVRELKYYRLFERIPKADAVDYEVFVENFRRVEANEPYAAADGVERRAEAPFYPVLLSAYGYQDVFGYAAELIGTLPEAGDGVEE